MSIRELVVFVTGGVTSCVLFKVFHRIDVPLFQICVGDRLMVGPFLICASLNSNQNALRKTGI